MARSQKQIESQITDIKRQIQDAQELQAIATFAGADRLLSLLKRTRDFYVQAMQNLDESGPALDREYAKRRACFNLIDGFINGMAGADDKIVALKTQFLVLNEELQIAMDEINRREKRNM
ncbi:MAG: hypothetical protein PHI84_22095 [Kiritimatiellae bacterium]|nr:hypothetical protein [Kiritimatiellia bacterium]